MAQDRDPLRRVLGDMDPSWFGDPVRELGLFQACGTVAEIRGVFREQVEVEVSAMLALLEDADAFDVIELMRMREFPPVPDPRVVIPDGSAIVIEIVTCALLARGKRKLSAVPRDETRPHEGVSDLHNRARRLSRLGMFRHMLEARMNPDPMAQIAAEYQSAVLLVRNLQYDTIRDRHEALLFNHPVVAELMSSHLGYSYAAVLKMRSAMIDLSAARMTKLRDESAEILMRHPNTPPGQVPPEELQAFMDLIIPFIFLPADRAIITAEDVAKQSGVPVGQVTKVLDSYSQIFDDSEPAGNRVYSMLVGANPFLLTPLVSDGTGAYVSTTNDVGLDSLRRILEAALPTNSDDVRRYDQKARQIVSEQLALEHLETILGAAPAHSGFKYFAPERGRLPSDLGADAPELNKVAKQVEADGLFLIDDVAICVEVKAKSIAAAARRGDVRRLTTDLKATVGDASNQAIRLQTLIETNRGIWLGNRTWLPLEHIQEVRSVVVLLDDLGPLGTALGDLQRVGIVPRVRPPWVTSLHDLATIAEINERPSEFLLYLRRRTDSGVTTHYRAEDELDLYMLFLGGKLYVAPDPDRTRTEHPAVPPVKKHERREHAQDAVGTLVADHCGELNAWMGRHDIEEHNNPPDKPRFNAPEGIVSLIDALAAADTPGAVRTGADLLGLAGETQQKLLRLITERARATRKDGQFHEVMLSFAGLWGHPTLYIAAAPHTGDWAIARKRLETYMRAKKHQVQSDRAFGMLFDAQGNLVHTIYMNDPAGDDPALDTLGSEMQLQPIGDRTRTPTPPSARRATRRLRGSRRKR